MLFSYHSLIKRSKKGDISSFNVIGDNAGIVTLLDKATGGVFYFSKEVLWNQIKNGLLEVVLNEDKPLLLNNKISKNHSSVQKSKVNKAKKIRIKNDVIREDDTVVELGDDDYLDKYRSEVSIRYKYVTDALNQCNQITRKNIIEWLQGYQCQIEGASKPSYRTLERWIHRYKSSGYNKSSLLPSHRRKGNRQSRSPNQLDKVLQLVFLVYVRDINIKKRRKIIYTEVHFEFLRTVNRLNQICSKAGKPYLNPWSYETTKTKVKSIVKHQSVFKNSTV